MQTKYCVRCLDKKAKVWTSHVLKDGEEIIAGWCHDCNDSPKSLGFVGHYKKRMGCQKSYA